MIGDELNLYVAYTPSQTLRLETGKQSPPVQQVNVHDCSQFISVSKR